MNWSFFAEAAPELARLAEERFEKTGLVLLGTIRRNGTPRISPIEYVILDGQFLLGVMWQSKKFLDLIRDPRCLVHSIVTNKDGTDGEIKLRGSVVEVTDPEWRERLGQHSFDTTGWRPEEPYHLYWLDLESASFLQFSGSGDQTVKTWRAGGREQSRVRKWTGSGYADDPA